MRSKNLKKMLNKIYFSDVFVCFSVTVVKKKKWTRKILHQMDDFSHIPRWVGSGWIETGCCDVPCHQLSVLNIHEVRHERGNLRGWMICAFQEAWERRTATGWMPEGREWDLKRMNEAHNWNEMGRWCPVRSRPTASAVAPCMICPITSEYMHT